MLFLCIDSNVHVWSYDQFGFVKMSTIRMWYNSCEIVWFIGGGRIFCMRLVCSGGRKGGGLRL
jgi:hypothetical protein